MSWRVVPVLWGLVVGLVADAGMAWAQLAPGVLKLSQVKRGMAVRLAELPSFSCLETVSRSVRSGASGKMSPLDTVAAGGWVRRGE